MNFCFTGCGINGKISSNNNVTFTTDKGIQTIINKNNIIHIKSKTIEKNPIIKPTNTFLQSENSNESNKYNELEIIDYPYPKNDPQKILNNTNSKKSKSNSSSVISENNDYNKIDKTNSKSENEGIKKSTITTNKISSQSKIKKKLESTRERSKTKIRKSKSKNFKTIYLNKININDNIKLMFNENNNYLNELLYNQKKRIITQNNIPEKNTGKFAKIKISSLKMNNIISRISLKKTRISEKYSSLNKPIFINDSPVTRKKSIKKKKNKYDKYDKLKKYETIDNRSIYSLNNKEISKCNYKFISSNNNKVKIKSRCKKVINPFSKKYIKNCKRISYSVKKFINSFKSSYVKK